MQIRRSGKTTNRALAYMSQAISQPYVWIPVVDHEPSLFHNKTLMLKIADFAEKLSLNFEVKEENNLFYIRSNHLGYVEENNEVRFANVTDLK